jgi:hypothetical protein
MLRVFNGLVLVLGVAFLGGCVTGPNPTPGAIYTGIKGPNEAVAGKDAGEKVGTSCASSVLGLVGWGDASVDTARIQGKIQNIAAVDYKGTSVLGFVYAQTCAVVTGS